MDKNRPAAKCAWVLKAANALGSKTPKRGFTNKRFKTVYAIVNVEQLNVFEKGTEINEAVLVEAGIVKTNMMESKS